MGWNGMECNNDNIVIINVVNIDIMINHNDFYYVYYEYFTFVIMYFSISFTSPVLFIY